MSWQVRQLQDLCAQVTSGGTPPTSRPEYYGGDIPWLRTQEVSFNRITDTELKITQDGLTNSAAKWIPEHSVIVAMYGNSAGRVATNQISLTTNQACCNLIVDAAKADYRFLYYRLLLDYEVLHQMAKGAAQNNLNAGQIKTYSIRVPLAFAQERIADILSAYDDLIENNRRRMALLEETARQLYHEWFVRFHFPGHEHTRITHGVPEGWERAPFETALVLQRGFDLPLQDREEGSVPIYGSTGINGFHSKAKVPGPGVVTGRSGTLGEVQYVPTDFWPLNTSLWVKEFRRVSPLFAVFLMREMDLRQYNGGVSVPTLDRKTVHKAQVLIPTRRLMVSFDEFVTPLFRQISTLAALVERLRAARDLLLPRLMNGEIVV